MSPIAKLSLPLFAPDANKSEAIADSHWGSLPSELLEQITCNKVSKSVKLIASLHGVCCTWRLFALSHLTSLRPKSIENIDVLAPRFSQISEITISKDNCKEFWKLTHQNHRNQHHVLNISSETDHPIAHAISYCSFFPKVTYDFSKLIFFKNLVRLQIESNDYIDDLSFKTLNSLAALRFFKANQCSALRDLSEMSNQRWQSLELRKCSQIGNLGVKRIAEISDLCTLILSDCSIGEMGLIDLKRLSKLTYLSLSNCHYINGKNLSALSTLRNLVQLNLDNLQSLHPSATEIFTFIKKVRKISIHRNRITETVLKNIAELDLLGDLDLTGCSFSAQRPLKHLKHLQKLTCLVLAQNRLETIDHLTALTQLKRLQMKRSFVLQETSLCQLSLLQNLIHLDVSNCNIISIALMAIGTATQLTYLNVGQSSHQIFSERIFGPLPCLKHLNLRHWKKLDPLLKGLLHSYEITHLDLSNTDFDVQNFLDLIHLHQLTYLNLNWCSKLKEWSLQNLPKLDRLKQIRLAGFQASEKNLRFLINCPNLESIDLSFCYKLKKEALSCLTPLEKLRQLNLRETAISSFSRSKSFQRMKFDPFETRRQDLPAFFSLSFNHLNHLNLSGCAVSDSVLSELKRCLPKTKVIPA